MSRALGLKLCVFALVLVLGGVWALKRTKNLKKSATETAATTKSVAPSANEKNTAPASGAGSATVNSNPAATVSHGAPSHAVSNSMHSDASPSRVGAHADAVSASVSTSSSHSGHSISRPRRHNECVVLDPLTGPSGNPELSEKQWGSLKSLVTSVKKDLGRWLTTRTKHLAPTEVTSLRDSLKNLRVERPPYSDEPDLATHGMGVVTRDDSGPVVRIGQRFVELLPQDPRRAKFELTRLLSQGWSPCKSGGYALCETGVANAATNTAVNKSKNSRTIAQENAAPVLADHFLETAWEISTLLAMKVNSPGCIVPGAVPARPQSRTPSAAKNVGERHE